MMNKNKTIKNKKIKKITTNKAIKSGIINVKLAIEAGTCLSVTSGMSVI